MAPFTPQGDIDLRDTYDILNPKTPSDVSISGTPVTNDFARFTDASTIEGRSYSEVRTDLNVADGATANSSDATLLDRANHTGTQLAATISDFDAGIASNSAVAANTAKTGITAQQSSDITDNNAKISYTDSAAVGLNTTHRTSDGKDHSDVVTNNAKISYTDATDVGLNTTHRGSDGKDHSDVVTNNSKVSNVTTDLSLGTITATTMDVNSSDGTNATLIEATTDDAGLLGSSKWDEIVANNAKVTNATHSGDVTGATALIIAADAVTYAKIQNVVNDERILGRVSGADGVVEELTKTEVLAMIGVEDGAEVNNISDVNATDLTDGGDTTLHDHDGISENTAARHTQNTDTALGSGAVAADHGTAATDQIINVSYGTSATPPTASTTTEGSLYVQYTA